MKKSIRKDPKEISEHLIRPAIDEEAVMRVRAREATKQSQGK
jgi:hypothetical protein